MLSNVIHYKRVGLIKRTFVAILDIVFLLVLVFILLFTSLGIFINTSYFISSNETLNPCFSILEIISRISLIAVFRSIPFASSTN